MSFGESPKKGGIIATPDEKVASINKLGDIFMRILKPKSILKTLPTNIKFEQFLILDALRFTLEIIEINYNDLLRELNKVASQKKKNIPKAFNSAWNIIDNIQRLNEIYKKYPQETELTLFKDIAEIKFFRHSYQHLEDRIEEIIIDKQLPVFGALKWAVNKKDKTFFSCLAISGKFYGKETSILNPADCINKAPISQIILMTTVRQNKKTFEKEINISELIHALCTNVSKLETCLMASIKEKNLTFTENDILTDLVLNFHHKENIA